MSIYTIQVRGKDGKYVLIIWQKEMDGYNSFLRYPILSIIGDTVTTENGIYRLIGYDFSNIHDFEEPERPIHIQIHDDWSGISDSYHEEYKQNCALLAKTNRLQKFARKNRHEKEEKEYQECNENLYYADIRLCMRSCEYDLMKERESAIRALNVENNQRYREELYNRICIPEVFAGGVEIDGEFHNVPEREF